MGGCQTDHRKWNQTYRHILLHFKKTLIIVLIIIRKNKVSRGFLAHLVTEDEAYVHHYYRVILGRHSVSL